MNQPAIELFPNKEGIESYSFSVPDIHQICAKSGIVHVLNVDVYIELGDVYPEHFALIRAIRALGDNPQSGEEFTRSVADIIMTFEPKGFSVMTTGCSTSPEFKGCESTLTYCWSREDTDEDIPGGPVV